MSEQPSIRDELAATIRENFNACRGRTGVSTDALAQAILASPVIRRIQAEAIREATETYWHDHSLTRYGEARDWFERCANRVEKGDADV